MKAPLPTVLTALSIFAISTTSCERAPQQTSSNETAIADTNNRIQKLEQKTQQLEAAVQLLKGDLATQVQVLEPVISAVRQTKEKAKRIQAVNNARQIIIAMKSYARDHNGAYPDADPSRPKTANDVLRLLVKLGFLEDERAFGAPDSPAHPDNNLGGAPDYKQTLEPGENHWAVVTGLSDSSPGVLPLIFECANDTAWPPTWNANVAGQPVRGRSWGVAISSLAGLMGA